MSDPTTLPAATHATHTVLNQPPPLEDVNLFTSDRVLSEALRREGAEWAGSQARTFGEILGRRETISWGFQANENPPALRAFDRNGNRIDEVEFHPAWHALMGLGVEHGLHALPWREPRPVRTGSAPIARGTTPPPTPTAPAAAPRGMERRRARSPSSALIPSV